METQTAPLRAKPARATDRIDQPRISPTVRCTEISRKVFDILAVHAPQWSAATRVLPTALQTTTARPRPNRDAFDRSSPTITS